MRSTLLTLFAGLAIFACNPEARPGVSGKNQAATDETGGTQKRMVTISGGVRSPQRISWSSNLTLMGAIGRAGGVTWDTVHRVTIVRGKERISVDLTAITRKGGTDPKLQPGDEVEVP
jgi:hypothetical protein